MWNLPRLIFFVLNFVISSIITARSAAQTLPSELIYGNDTRREAADSDFAHFIPAVAAKISRATLTSTGPLPNLRQLKNLCPEEETFAEQIPLSTCSGFLIAPRLLLTAGHCMVTQQDCSEHMWAFGWTQEQEHPETLVACERIIAQQWRPGDKKIIDYALVLLNEDPPAAPLPLRRRGHAYVGTTLTMLGHPLGLSMKVADQAKITLLDRHQTGLFRFSWDIIRRSLTRDPYYNTNLDSFAGNSGSPVFNAKSGVVEGMLISGGEDFEWDSARACRRHVRDGRRPISAGEKILRPNAIPNIWDIIEKALDSSLI